MTQLPLYALAGAAGLLGTALVAAQAPPETPPPAAASFAVPPYKNLKVLPQDIGRSELLSTMKFFSQSLGVRCTHCHVGEEGQPLSTFDFASDAKSAKQTARAMLAMVGKINAQEFGVTGPGGAKVTCYTCHRGATKPLTAPPAENPAPPAPPAAASTEAERG